MQTLKEEITKMSTQELEAHIDSRYEAGASQTELEALETAFAGRVSEDELSMTEDEPDMREAYDMGIDLEEWLAIEYFQYLNPNERVGGRAEEDYFSPDCFNDFLSLNLKPGITRQDILSAAQDAYQYKQRLIHRQKYHLSISM
jgi:hypothetical protein